MLTAFFGYVTELTCLILLFATVLIRPSAPVCTCECKCGRRYHLPAVFPSDGEVAIKQSTDPEPEGSKSVTEKEPRQSTKTPDDRSSYPIEQQQQRTPKPATETPQPIIQSISNLQTTDTKPIEFQTSTKSIEPIDTPVKEEPLATPVYGDKESGRDVPAPTEEQIQDSPSIGRRLGDWEAEREINRKTAEEKNHGWDTEPFKSPTSKILDSFDKVNSSYRTVEESRDGEILDPSKSPAKSETRSEISRPTFNGRPLPPHQVRSTDTLDHGYDFRSSIETSSYTSKRKNEPAVCKPCNKQFKSAAALQQDGFHSPHMCEICNEDYHSAYDLRQHKMEKHPWAMLCPECLVTFTHAHDARDHYELVHGSEPASFTRTQRMLDTIHSSSPSPGLSSASASASASNYAESTNATRARTAKPPQYQILASYDSHVVQAEHRCEQCEMVFPNAMDLRAHVNSPFSHGGEKLTPDNFPPLGSPSVVLLSESDPIVPWAPYTQPAWDTSMPSFVLAARSSSNRQQFNSAISPEAKLTPDDSLPEIETEETVPKWVEVEVEVEAAVENAPAIGPEDVALGAEHQAEHDKTEYEQERPAELERGTELEHEHKFEEQGLNLEPDSMATPEPITSGTHHSEVEEPETAAPPVAVEPIMKNGTPEAPVPATIQDEQNGPVSQIEQTGKVHDHTGSPGRATVTGSEISSEPAPRDNTFKHNYPLPPQSKAAKKAMARQLYRNAPKQPKQPKKAKSKQKTQELFESDEDVDFELPSDFEQLTGMPSEFGVSVTFIDEGSRPLKKEINVQDDLTSSNSIPKSLYSTARAKLDLPPATYQHESDEEDVSGVVVEKQVTAVAPEARSPAFDEEVIEIRRTIYAPRYDDYSDEGEKPEVDSASAEKHSPEVGFNDAAQEEEQEKDTQAPLAEPIISNTFQDPIVTDMPEMVESLFVTHATPADLAGPEPATYDQVSEKARSSNVGAEEPFEPSSGLQQDQHLSETAAPSTAVKSMGPAETVETVEGTEAVDEMIAEQAPLSFDLAFVEVDAERDVITEATPPSEAAARPLEATNGTEHEGPIGEAIEADTSGRIDGDAEDKTLPELYQVDSSFTPAALIQPLPLPSDLPDPEDGFAQPIFAHDQAPDLADALQSSHPDSSERTAVADSPKQLAESVQIASSAPPVMEGAGAEAAREEEPAAVEVEEAARAAQALAEAEAEFAAAAAVIPLVKEDEPSMIGNIEFSVPSFTFSESNTATITSTPLSLSTSEKHEERQVEVDTTEPEQPLPSIAPADDDHWAESEEVYRIAIANRSRPPLNLAPIRDRDNYEDDSRPFKFPPNRRINNHNPTRKRNSMGSNGWGPKPIPRPFKNSTNALEKMRSARSEVEDERAKERERRKGATSIRSSSFSGADESGWISMDSKSHHNDHYGGSVSRYGDNGDSEWRPNDRQGWGDNRRASVSNSITTPTPQNNNWGSLPGVADGDTGGW
ncbi:hypothetical protein I305_02205 [Cryptococcus gattii E566]|nr:hypothetical protein I305_02205 [Cryptococcus gattii E566]